MITPKLIRSSILAPLLLAVTTLPAFAGLTWTEDDPGIRWAYGTLKPTSLGQEIKKVGVGMENEQYVFRMYLEGAPSSADTGTIYGLYFNSSSPPADYSIESLLRSKDKTVLFYSHLQGDNSVPLAPKGFSINGNVLQWKVDKSSILSSSFAMIGLTSGSIGNIYDETEVAATPIPTTAWLFGCGIIGLIGIKRRNQRLTDGTVGAVTS